MPIADLNGKRFKYNGKSYYTAGAGEMLVGSIGEKRSPLGKPKNLDKKADISADKIGELKSTVIDVRFDDASKRDIDALAPIVISGVPILVSAAEAHQGLMRGDLKLVHLRAEDQRLERAANDSPRRLDDLISWGRDARIVSQTFVVVEAAVAEKFRSNARVGVWGTDLGIGARVGGAGGRAGSVEVEYAPGATFAYLLAKITWDAKMKKNRRFIEDLDDDQYGTG